MSKSYSLRDLNCVFCNVLFSSFLILTCYHILSRYCRIGIEANFSKMSNLSFSSILSRGWNVYPMHNFFKRCVWRLFLHNAYCLEKPRLKKFITTWSGCVCYTTTHELYFHKFEYLCVLYYNP